MHSACTAAREDGSAQGALTSAAVSSYEVTVDRLHPALVVAPVPPAYNVYPFDGGHDGGYRRHRGVRAEGASRPGAYRDAARPRGRLGESGRSPRGRAAAQDAGQ